MPDFSLLMPLFRIVCLLTASVLISSCGWFGGYGTSEYQQLKDKKANFDDLVQQMGGTAEERFFELLGVSGMAWVIDLSGAQYTPDQFEEFMESLPAMGYIAGMNFSGSAITDEQLLEINEGKYGRVCMNLDLGDTAITDTGIDGITNFYCLNKLNLKNTQVTEGAVGRFKQRQKQNPDVQIPFRNPKIQL